MIDRLNIFALEVGKVCLEVGKNGERRSDQNLELDYVTLITSGKWFRLPS